MRNRKRNSFIPHPRSLRSHHVRAPYEREYRERQLRIDRISLWVSIIAIGISLTVGFNGCSTSSKQEVLGETQNRILETQNAQGKLDTSLMATQVAQNELMKDLEESQAQSALISVSAVITEPDPEQGNTMMAKMCEYSDSSDEKYYFHWTWNSFILTNNGGLPTELLDFGFSSGNCSWRARAFERGNEIKLDQEDLDFPPGESRTIDVIASTKVPYYEETCLVKDTELMGGSYQSSWQFKFGNYQNISFEDPTYPFVSLALEWNCAIWDQTTPYQSTTDIRELQEEIDPFGIYDVHVLGFDPNYGAPCPHDVWIEGIIRAIEPMDIAYVWESALGVESQVVLSDSDSHHSIPNFTFTPDIPRAIELPLFKPETAELFTYKLDEAEVLYVRIHVIHPVDLYSNVAKIKARCSP